MADTAKAKQSQSVMPLKGMQKGASGFAENASIEKLINLPSNRRLQPDMSSNPTESKVRNVVSGPLLTVYETYKDMYENNIIFGYRGLVTSDLVTSVLDIMEERLEEDGQSKKLSKKVFNVMVECLTNVYVDEDKGPQQEGYDPQALLLVKRVNNSYRVITGNQIQTASVGELKQMIDRINNMGHEELKSYYQEVLGLEEPISTGLTNLAIVDLARKSKNKLIYNFKYESKHFTFFTLESEISYNSL